MSAIVLPRNTAAKSLRDPLFKQRKVQPRKGKGSYKRNGKEV